MKLFERRGKKNAIQELPIVPLKELVVFPHMVVPFFAGRKGSIQAIEQAMAGNRLVFLGPQKNPQQKPKEEGIYESGTIARILQMMKLPDGTLRVLVEGKERGSVVSYVKGKIPFKAKVKTIGNVPDPDNECKNLMRFIQDTFENYAKENKKISKESVQSVMKASEDPDKLIDIVCANIPIKIEKKIEFLSITDTKKRLQELAITLQSEQEIQELQQDIHNRVRKRIEKTQKEYYLQEQVKEINKELGRDADDPTGAKEIHKQLQEKDLPQEIRTKAEKELKRLEKLQPIAPEAGVLRTYLEWILELPWNTYTEDNEDIDNARKILDQDHYDMKKPKERITEYLAVHQLNEEMKGPILCFVGPPGTGKTSLGKSLARALGREFVRISLGGVRDEAEIRGHRKTYVGSLPGKIIQSIKKAGTKNPVFLLDEIDKLSSDFRGDPASALLEVLDPEQNANFTDHYLEVPFDLSKVMFITTANSLHTIPYPLRDRMEIIQLPGYSEWEKLHIAKDFLVPKQKKENGVQSAQIRFRKDAILEIIRSYTMESGVRNLEREIASVIRKIATDMIEKGYKNSLNTYNTVITNKRVHALLGKEKFKKNLLYNVNRPGLSYGLAWTEMGGTIIPVETALFEGNGKLVLTGSLGDVMKESAQTAFSYLKSTLHVFKLDSETYQNKDIHVHVPEGAIPKDGPSAGITITASILSALSGFPVLPAHTMTGEVTLTGRLLPVGGIKEKVLAARRYGITTVILPGDNRNDKEELPEEVLSSMTFIFCDSVLDALKKLFSEELFQIRSY